jgi:hypothetical protein
MRRLLARFAVRIMIALCLLIGAARVVGSMSDYPAREMLRQFECEPQPCWHGIHLGMTRLAEARTLLSADANIRIVAYDPTADYLCWAWTNEWHNPNSQWDACYFPYPDSSVTLQLTYANRPPLRLGDVLPLMGNPLTSDLMCNAATPGGILFNERMGILVFEHFLVKRIVPELKVASISYLTPEGNIISPQKVRRWTGFTGWADVESRCSG